MLLKDIAKYRLNMSYMGDSEVLVAQTELVACAQDVAKRVCDTLLESWLAVRCWNAEQPRGTPRCRECRVRRDKVARRKIRNCKQC